MDVNRSQGSQNLRAQERYREAMIDLVRRTRGKVQAAREEALRTSAEQTAARRAEAEAEAEANAEARRTTERTREDRIEISRALHARVSNTRAEEARDASRPAIERLRAAYEKGEVNTPERIERAAENLLRGGANAEPNLADG